LQWRAQISRRNRRNVAQYMVEFVLRDFNRNNGRRQICSEWQSYVCDLSETRVWVQHVKSTEASLPIFKGAHQGKRGRLPHPIHSVAFVDDVTTPAMLQRQFLASHRVAIERHLNRNRLGSNLRGKYRDPVFPKRFNGSLANVGQQPVGKQFDARRIAGRNMPYCVQPNKNRNALRSNDHISPLFDLRDPHAVFQRKARQEILQETGLRDLRCSRERETLTLSLYRQRERQTKKKTAEFHIKLSAGKVVA